MRRARMLVDHRAPDRPAIRIARGDTLSLGERDHEWPQFVWAVQADGLGGWAPASLFDRDHGAATAQSDYDTVELDAAAGAVVRLHHELAQWWWASDVHGRQGWIPARALQLLEDADTFTAGSIA